MWPFTNILNFIRPAPPPPPPAPQPQADPGFFEEFIVDPFFFTPSAGLSAFMPSAAADVVPAPLAVRGPHPGGPQYHPGHPGHHAHHAHRAHAHHRKHGHAEAAPKPGGYNPLLLGLLSGEIGCDDGDDLGQSAILKGGRHG